MQSLTRHGLFLSVCCCLKLGGDSGHNSLSKVAGRLAGVAPEGLGECTREMAPLSLPMGGVISLHQNALAVQFDTHLPVKCDRRKGVLWPKSSL